MSKKKTPSCCLVIDASIARAAGPVESVHPTGSRCRDFLLAVRSVCHRMAWSEAIRDEWNEYQSRFAAQWRVSMRSIGKLRRVQDELLAELHDAIQQHSEDPHVVEKMLKDAHLFEAALATDLRIASWDANARRHFGRLAESFHALRPVMWVDPVTERAKAVEWLEDGAPAKSSRRLRK